MDNPFSKGNSGLNCLSTFYSSLPPSCLDLRTIVIADESATVTAMSMMTAHPTSDSTSYQVNDYECNNHHVNFCTVAHQFDSYNID
jgi:hypothetical protein